MPKANGWPAPEAAAVERHIRQAVAQAMTYHSIYC